MGYLEALHLEQHQEILELSTKSIDEDSNKLLLAVTVYLDKQWFHQD